MIELCFATNNAHKLEEITTLLGDNFKLKTLKEIDCEDDLPETTDTIEGNSYQKAQYVWENFGISCFADDSGLEIRALKGRPGVHSAHYSGVRDHALNIKRVLEEMLHMQDRSAQFKTVITLILQGQVQQFEGIVRGQLLKAPRGQGGFGYDPIFVPEGYDRTFAEMTLKEKSQISHRAKAFDMLIKFLKNKVPI